MVGILKVTLKNGRKEISSCEFPYGKGTTYEEAYRLVAEKYNLEVVKEAQHRSICPGSSTIRIVDIDAHETEIVKEFKFNSKNNF